MKLSVSQQLALNMVLNEYQKNLTYTQIVNLVRIRSGLVDVKQGFNTWHPMLLVQFMYDLENALDRSFREGQRRSKTCVSKI